MNTDKLNILIKRQTTLISHNKLLNAEYVKITQKLLKLNSDIPNRLKIDNYESNRNKIYQEIENIKVEANLITKSLKSNFNELSKIALKIEDIKKSNIKDF